MTDKPDLIKRRTVKLALASALSSTLGCTTRVPTENGHSVKDAEPLFSQIFTIAGTAHLMARF